jgi:hypothetical protein
MSPYELLLLLQQCDDIATAGWTVTAVLPDEPDEAHVAYTVGLTGIGAPELVITGLRPDLAHALLGDLAERAIGGQRWTHRQRLDDLLLGHPAVIIDGTPTEQIVPGTACAIYGPDHVRLQQIVWPDPADRFPWDRGYQYAAHTQPLLTTT